MKRSCSIGLAAALLSIASAHAAPVNPSGSGPKPDQVTPVLLFLETLAPETRARATFPYEAPGRRRWDRSPSPRAGVSVNDLSAAQRTSLRVLLKSVLGPAGYEKAVAIMENQNVLGKVEDGLGVGYFWFAVYGEPRNDEPWGWRFGGHHLSLHMHYSGGALDSCTPAFMGVSGDFLREMIPDEFTDALAKRRTEARLLIETLEGEQRAQALLAAAASDELVIGENATVPFDETRGLTASQMTGEQRALLFRLMQSYAADFAPGIGQAQFQRLESPRPDRLLFAFAGDAADARDLYYRVQSPGFLLEYRSLSEHVHSLWRDANDFGGPSGD